MILSTAARKTSGLLRGLLSATLVGGAFPSAHHRNAYVPQERGMPPRHGGHGIGGIDDDDEEAEQVSNELEQVRLLLHLPKNKKGAIHKGLERKGTVRGYGFQKNMHT